MKSFLCTLALLGSVAAHAASLVYNFSYAAHSGTLAGQVEGELQADGNTVVVTAVQDYVSLNGVSTGVALTQLGHWEPISPFAQGFVFGGASRLSLDGSIMDFGACASTCANAFYFAPPQLVFPFTLFLSTAGLGLGAEVFDPTLWSLTAGAATLPAPGTLPLLALALTGLVVMRRRVV
jgi:hypothetical protein